MKPMHWMLAAGAALLLSCQNNSSSEDAKAMEESLPDEPMSQEAADQQAADAIDADNADAEFDRLMKEIESDQ